MKLHILDDRRFTCRSCARCCRDIHVQVTEQEVARLSALAWPAGDPSRGAGITQTIAGRIYLKHRPDGSCLYLNPDNQLCRIHEHFGPQAKPLGCQLFPFQLSASFDDEISVTGRYYCPTIRRNEGASVTSRRAELTSYAQALGLRGGLTSQALRGLSRQQAQHLVRLTVEHLFTLSAGDERALLLYELARWLAEQPPDLVQEAAIRRALDEAGQKAKASVEQYAGQGLPGILQVALRGLLTVYLRRDDDVADGRVKPWQRARSVGAVIMGRGNLADLGAEHPAKPLADVPVFTQPYELAEDSAMDLFWDMVRVKLVSMQFVGPANFHRDLVDGLRSLVLLQPLVVVTAKVHACSMGRGVSLTGADVHYAVGAVEHGFGRQPLLNTPLSRYFEGLLLRPDILPRVLLAV